MTTFWIVPASAQSAPPPRGGGAGSYQQDELVTAGHRFFGNVSRGLASVIERAVSQWGLPNGYVLGEEGSGAFVAGLRYGEGTLYTKNAGDLKVYWQGPSVGFDWGGDGARTMTLSTICRPPTRSISASPASKARPISSAASA